MKRKYSCLAIVAAAAISLSAEADIVEFVVPLDGLQEVPPADLDGTGTAFLTIDSVALTIDWHIEVADIDLPLNGAHIHMGNAGQNGSVVVNFSAQLDGAGLFDADLASVLANPEGFYVNLHNTPFPGGAIRGQIPPPVVDMPCEGDANADGTVDPLDAGYVLARLGCSVGTGDPDCDAADTNLDGIVDPLDVGFVLARFGDCP